MSTTTAPETVTTWAHTLPASVVTVRVPGTDKAVTFDRETYAGKAVRLHDADAHPYIGGETIGVLGSMVGHGAYATMGQPVGSWDYVPAEAVLGWWVERAPRAEVAIRMARIALGDATAKPEGYHERA